MVDETVQKKNVSFSSDTKDSSSRRSNEQKVSFDSTFDTTFDESQFQYSAEDAPWDGNLFDSDDPFLTDSDALSRISPHRKSQTQHRVSMRIHERLSIHFDQVSSSPVCRIVGTVHVNPTQEIPASFCLTVRDKQGHVERYETADDCTNITGHVPHLALDPDDQLFRISLQNIEAFEAPVLGYSCVSHLNPMPMLLKNKVKRNGPLCQVAIRIRANPKNKRPLERMVVVVAIPPDVDGSSGTYSRKGAMWDAMKRTICWTHDKLHAGEVIDIKAQFPCVDNGTVSTSFPILTRCDGRSLFSRVELCSDYTDDSSPPVKLYVDQTTSRVLYRSV